MARVSRRRPWILGRNGLATFLDQHRVYLVVPSGQEGKALREAKGRLRRILDGPRYRVLSNVPSL